MCDNGGGHINGESSSHLYRVILGVMGPVGVGIGAVGAGAVGPLGPPVEGPLPVGADGPDNGGLPLPGPVGAGIEVGTGGPLVGGISVFGKFVGILGEFPTSIKILGTGGSGKGKAVSGSFPG